MFMTEYNYSLKLFHDLDFFADKYIEHKRNFANKSDIRLNKFAILTLVAFCKVDRNKFAKSLPLFSDFSPTELCIGIFRSGLFHYTDLLV